jgi:hypothetical protein
MSKCKGIWSEVKFLGCLAHFWFFRGDHLLWEDLRQIGYLTFALYDFLVKFVSICLVQFTIQMGRHD